MKDPSLAMQKWTFDTLTAGLDSGIGVYDRVPVDAAGKVTAKFPYCHIGEDHVVSDADQCHDAASVYSTVHVWSRAVGKVEAKTIMGGVVDLLDVVPTPVGFQAITHVVDDGPRHMDGGDGLTSHSLVTFHYRMAPTS